MRAVIAHVILGPVIEHVICGPVIAHVILGVLVGLHCRREVEELKSRHHV